MCQANFLATTMTACLLRLSLVSMSTSMEIAFNRSFCVRLLLLGSQGGASSLEAPWITGTGTPNLDPFFLPLLLTITFDQTTIKHSLYMQKVH